jgi:hypothetical protein
MTKELRPIQTYIADDDAEDLALIDLQRHLVEYNSRYGRRWSLVLPKRRPLKTPIGLCKDNNHRLYQEHVDAILAGCPRPLTVEAIRQKLVDVGEKVSTAKLLAPDYYNLITKVLDPGTKMHRQATKTLIEWGTP